MGEKKRDGGGGVSVPLTICLGVSKKREKKY